MYNRQMQRFYSDIIGSEVIAKRQKLLIGKVVEIIINPADGKLAGLLIEEGRTKGKIKALAEKDIFGFGQGLILIDDYNNLGEIKDIVRIKKLSDEGIKIVKIKVYTVSGFYLGKVRDYTIDLAAKKIARLYINPKFFGQLTSDLVVGSEMIVTIKKEQITVIDRAVKIKDKPLKASLRIKAPTTD